MGVGNVTSVGIHNVIQNVPLMYLLYSSILFYFSQCMLFMLIESIESKENLL